MERLADIFVAKPDQARDGLRNFIRRVTMFPTETGVKFKISLQASLVLPPAANERSVLESAAGREPTRTQLAPLE
jgi:hypothetical protein